MGAGGGVASGEGGDSGEGVDSGEGLTRVRATQGVGIPGLRWTVSGEEGEAETEAPHPIGEARVG